MRDMHRRPCGDTQKSSLAVLAVGETYLSSNEAKALEVKHQAHHRRCFGTLWVEFLTKLT